MIGLGPIEICDQGLSWSRFPFSGSEPLSLPLTVRRDGAFLFAFQIFIAVSSRLPCPLRSSSKLDNFRLERIHGIIGLTWTNALAQDRALHHDSPSGKHGGFPFPRLTSGYYTRPNSLRSKASCINIVSRKLAVSDPLRIFLLFSCLSLHHSIGRPLCTPRVPPPYIGHDPPSWNRGCIW